MFGEEMDTSEWKNKQKATLEKLLYVVKGFILPGARQSGPYSSGALQPLRQHEG